MVQVDFIKMINIHVALKNYLTDLLSNEEVKSLDYVKIKQVNVCYLGKLIENNMHELVILPAYEEVRKLHANFHGLTAEILRLYQADQPAKATQLLHGRFEMVFRKLKSRIILLSQQYNATHSSLIKLSRILVSAKASHTPHF
jgi:hypothetical protein